MTLLDAGERKVPEIMVHELQKALADQLDVLETFAVGLEAVKILVSKHTYICAIYQNIQNMQNMHKNTEICRL